MRALVAHPGTQHAFQLAVELYRRDALSTFHTGLALPAGDTLDWLIHLLPQDLRRRAVNRRIRELPLSFIRLQPVKELFSIAQVGLGRAEQRVFHWRNERFQREIPKDDLELADLTIGFDTSSWILTRRCRELGKPMILVQTIGHPDSRVAVENEIAARYPNWIETNEPRLPMVRAAEQEEHERASLIVASSSFSQQSLIDNGVSREKIRLLPHGVDCERFFVLHHPRPHPFRFIFAGAITARKGVPLLLEAWQRLQPINAELWLVGPASHKASSLIPRLPNFRHFGPVALRELPALFQQCDVFVFPSYFEGFGRVIVQAMACGLPVITTNATAGPDLLRNRKGGWIIPAGDLESLIEAMGYCLTNPDEVRSAGRAARHIAEKFTWREYGERWLTLLEEVTQQSKSDLLPVTVRSRTAPPVSVQVSATKLRRVLLVHPGTQYSGHLATQLQRFGLLEEFRTGFAFSEDSITARLANKMPAAWRRRFVNREVFQVPQNRLQTRPWWELIAFFALRLGRDEQKIIHWRNAGFQRFVPDASIQQADAVIGFDTSSWIVARRARELGRPFVLDQSIGHPRSFLKVAEQLSTEFPEWKESLPAKHDEHLARETQEHADASMIVVPSRFVARTLQCNGIDGEKIRINPFGVDLERYQPSPAPPPLKPLRFVFAGSLQARKGLPLLLNAWRSLEPNHRAELWIVGSGRIPTSVRGNVPENIRFLSRVVPTELSSLFQQCHVFVFPSYFEGLAQVQIEAAACGLPVIGTDSSGSEEIIRHEETGFILPTGDADALRATLVNLIANPEITLLMRSRLLAERSAWSWDAYGERWVDVLNEVVTTRAQPDALGAAPCSQS